MSDGNGDDDVKKSKVGYKSPPKHSQFKKGQSGHRAGRPRNKVKRYNIPHPDEALAEILSECVPATIFGKKQLVPKYKLVMAQFVNKAMAGEMAAIRLAMERYYALPGQYKDPEMHFFRYPPEQEERDRQFLRDAQEFVEEELKRREEDKKAGKAPPTTEETLELLASKGFLPKDE
jgi:hypothetical protein